MKRRGGARAAGHLPQALAGQPQQGQLTGHPQGRPLLHQPAVEPLQPLLGVVPAHALHRPISAFVLGGSQLQLPIPLPLVVFPCQGGPLGLADRVAGHGEARHRHHPLRLHLHPRRFRPVAVGVAPHLPRRRTDGGGAARDLHHLQGQSTREGHLPHGHLHQPRRHRPGGRAEGEHGHRQARPSAPHRQGEGAGAGGQPLQPPRGALQQGELGVDPGLVGFALEVVGLLLQKRLQQIPMGFGLGGAGLHQAQGLGGTAPQLQRPIGLRPQLRKGARRRRPPQPRQGLDGQQPFLRLPLAIARHRHQGAHGLPGRLARRRIGIARHGRQHRHGPPPVVRLRHRQLVDQLAGPLRLLAAPLLQRIEPRQPPQPIHHLRRDHGGAPRALHPLLTAIAQGQQKAPHQRQLLSRPRLQLAQEVVPGAGDGDPRFGALLTGIPLLQQLQLTQGCQVVGQGIEGQAQLRLVLPRMVQQAQAQQVGQQRLPPPRFLQPRHGPQGLQSQLTAEGEGLQAGPTRRPLPVAGQGQGHQPPLHPGRFHGHAPLAPLRLGHHRADSVHVTEHQLRHGGGEHTLAVLLGDHVVDEHLRQQGRDRLVAHHAAQLALGGLQIVIAEALPHPLALQHLMEEALQLIQGDLQGLDAGGGPLPH